MGYSFSNIHIKNNISRIKFLDIFREMMKKYEFVPCTEEEAELSCLLAFSDSGWVTLVSDKYYENPHKATESSQEMSKLLKTSCLSVETAANEFARLKLYKGCGVQDEVIIGDGSKYGIEKPVGGSFDGWKLFIADRKAWNQFSEIINKKEVLVKEALYCFGAALGIDLQYICMDFDKGLRNAYKNKNITILYFKQTAKKTLSLYIEFKTVFGEVLEPLGFRLIKSRYPFFVRVVNGEIIHCVSIGKEKADGREKNGVKYKCFNVYCGVSTVYRGNIDFDEDPSKFHFGFGDSISEIYIRNNEYNPDTDYYGSVIDFYYDPTDENSLTLTLKIALEATEKCVLPVFDEAVTLEKCMDYFERMGYLIRPFLGSGGEGLLSTRLFSADEYVMFCGRGREREIEQCRRKLECRSGLSSKETEALEARIRFLIERCEEGKKKSYEHFTNPEFQEQASAELERRKCRNIQKLREYGLNI